MKITSGFLKGMQLKVPPAEDTRPTSEKVRQAVMDMLLTETAGGSFLDMFAGSGAVGLEAASRGIEVVVFVEKNPQACLCLKQNIAEAERRFERQKLNGRRLELFPRGVGGSWERLASAGPYDVIWADPPYQQTLTWLQDAGGKLAGLARAGSLFVLESETLVANAGELLQGWQLQKEKKYGRTFITVFSYGGTT